MPRRGRVDANQTIIANAFRDHGATVHFTSDVGGGFPDFVAGYQGINILVEVKNPKQAPNKRKLRESQVKFRCGWRGWYVVIETVDDVISLLKTITENTKRQRRV